MLFMFGGRNLFSLAPLVFTVVLIAGTVVMRLRSSCSRRSGTP